MKKKSFGNQNKLRNFAVKTKQVTIRLTNRICRKIHNTSKQNVRNFPVFVGIEELQRRYGGGIEDR